MERVVPLFRDNDSESGKKNDSQDSFDTAELHKWLSDGGPSSTEVTVVDEGSVNANVQMASENKNVQSTVLCVEAQESIQAEFRKTFDKVGWRARMVKSSEIALEMARERSPDFIVYDADGQGRDSLDVFIEIDRISSLGRKAPRGLLLLGPKQVKLEATLSDSMRERYDILQKPLRMREVKTSMLACSIRD